MNRLSWYCLSRPIDTASDGDGRTADEERDQPAPWDTRDRQHAEDGRGEHEHGAEVGLQDDQHRRDAGQHAEQRHVDQANPALPGVLGALGDDHRHADHHRELGELGRLDRHPAEHQPGPRPVDRRTHDEHEEQADHRADVDERRDDPDPPVVGGHHRGREHQADQDVDQVLVQVRRGVAAGEHVVARGRRPDQQRADRQDQARLPRTASSPGWVRRRGVRLTASRLIGATLIRGPGRPRPGSSSRRSSALLPGRREDRPVARERRQLARGRGARRSRPGTASRSCP